VGIAGIGISKIWWKGVGEEKVPKEPRNVELLCLRRS